MKKIIQFAAIALATCSFAHAQVVPEATGPAKLPLSGNLSYALRYSQTAEFGGNLGDWQTGSISGSVNYSNGTSRHPFNLNYGGGYTKTYTGPDYETGVFQHLLISQGLVGRKWTATVSDNISFTPESPTIGFSGIPGTGEPVGGSGSNPPSSQSVLTLDTRTIANMAAAQIGYRMDYATTFNAGGSSNLLRYPDGNGLDTNGLLANAGVVRRLDVRNSLVGQFMFARYDYGNQTVETGQGSTSVPNPSFEFEAATFGFQRVWSPKLRTTASVGPQWISSSDSTIEPSSTTVAVNAAVIYSFRSETASVSYTRGASNGGGIVPGANADAVNASYSRLFRRDLTVGLTASYTRSDALELGGGTIDARYGGVQATRQLGRYFSVFANYTAEDQTTNQAAQSSQAVLSNVLDNFYQVIGFGIAFSPRETHLKR
jgi:hypothetical protein